jgi:outer membrane protein TolC
MNSATAFPIRGLASLAAGLLLAGCATVDFDRELGGVNEALPGFTAGKLQLDRAGEAAAARAVTAQALLSAPLTQGGAVELALAHSPALQALLAERWAAMAQADASGRLPNPVLSFERVRMHGELEFGRLLSFGLLDLLMLPQRQELARNQVAQGRVELAQAVVDQVSQVRRAWVEAVSAQQALGYARQVQQAAEASAELARRMQQAGNFNTLQRARQHAFYADATGRLAAAQHAATASRESLVRLLGLDDTAAAKLVLPQRLPDLPRALRAAQEVGAQAREQRLDWQLARLQLESAGRAQRLDLVHALVDTEVGFRRDTVFEPSGERASGRGFELSVRLPLFDWGSSRVAAMNAQSLAAARRYEAVTRAASSQLRQDYSAYRTAWELARHHQEEVVPLRRTISEENLLRYNAMQIGVFELLADSRDQVASVIAAIDAQRQFWLADASLSASLVGRPQSLDIAGPAQGGGAPADPGH